MKKYFVILFLSLVLVSCGKKETQPVTSNNQGYQKQQVSNAINTEITQSGETKTGVIQKNLEEEKKEISNTIKEKEKTINNNIFEDKPVFNPIKEEKYIYNFKMEKPNLKEMNNFEAITKGYTKEWKKTYKPTKEKIEEMKNCKEISFKNVDNRNDLKTVAYKDFASGKNIELKDNYTGKGYNLFDSFQGVPLTITGGILKFFENHGWTMLDPNWKDVSYDGPGDDIAGIDFKQEWYTYMKTLGGNTEEYRRYPFNTVYITSDLLLHSFHILFDNNLKYSEEANLRIKMGEISNAMFDKFKKLYSQTNDENLKKHYEFLTSYWAISSSLFMDLGNDYSIEEDKLFSMLKTNLEGKIKDLKKETKENILKEFDEILKAELQSDSDVLLSYFYPNINTYGIKITQDYSQFKPRSHYTTDNLLKTYFIGMKFFMREKFYFIDKDISKTALLQINNLNTEELKKFEEVYAFIKKLIGEDDDVNIYDLQKFIKDNKLDSDSKIVSNFDDKLHKLLMNYKTQNIISTSFETGGNFSISEEESHNKTAGFVFFGEKTTIDSWIYDNLTAGIAEKEGKDKASIVTGLSVPNILGNNALAGDLVKLWLEKNNISQTNYLDVSKTLENKITYFDFTKNIYHSWLDTLNYLFIDRSETAPYFMKDLLYKYKNLLTYMGSYTELKHDTLLYVKQTYAEIGGGGDCFIEIEPPSLPIPKGYIEPNIELIDKLISLSKETNEFYKDNKITKYIEFLGFSKKLALMQLKNEKISDEEFEKLRLYHIELQGILTPTKYIGEPLQKEERGSIIADIFTSGDYGPLYEAVGRPELILVMIKDTNSSRIVIGPVYTHYEFYGKSSPIKTDSRLTDENWQNEYDEIKNSDGIKGLESEYLHNKINSGE